MTKNRQLVLETVKSNNDHWNAEEIFFYIKKRDSSMVFATVYNSLNYLCAQGIIRRLHIPKQADRFDGNLMPHDHFVCNKCGKVYDVPSRFELKEYEDNMNNHIETCEIVYRGCCFRCRKKLN